MFKILLQSYYILEIQLLVILLNIIYMINFVISIVLHFRDSITGNSPQYNFYVQIFYFNLIIF